MVLLLVNKINVKEEVVAMVIAQYSFPINTESDTHGLRKQRVFCDRLQSCPPMEGLYPEPEADWNSHRVVIIRPRAEK